MLRWLGLDWDDGPYRQTERFDLYAAAVAELIARGAAYRCYCTEARSWPRSAPAARPTGRPLIYSGRCAVAAAEAERAALEAEGRPSVVRLAMPAAGTTAIADVVHGAVEWDNALLGDHVILRSDGSPTYQFANPFDDIQMGVTHVIRGEDLLPSTPRQLALYRALDAPEPDLCAPADGARDRQAQARPSATARSRSRSCATSA